MGRSKKTNKITKSTSLIPSGFMALALLILIPLIYSKSALDPVLYPRLIAWSISLVCILLVLLALRKQIQLDFRFLKSGFFIAFASFISISIVSLSIAINPIEGLTDFFKWMLFGITIFFVYSLLANSERNLEIIFKAIIINTGFAIIIGLYQFFAKTVLNPDQNTIYEIKGLMAHKNQFSISLFLLLPFLFSSLFFLNRTWKKINLFFLVTVILFIVILQTRSVWIAIFFSGIITCSLLFYQLGKSGYIDIKSSHVRKIMVPAFVIIALLFMVFYLFPEMGFVKLIAKRISSIFDVDSSSNEGRLQMWEATYRLFKDNLLLGVGGGNWKIFIYPYYSDYLPSVFIHWRNPHNDFIGIAGEKGIFGLLAFISMFVMLAYYSIRIFLRSKTKNEILLNGFMLFGLIGFLIVCFFSFPSERINHLIFVAFISAILLSLRFGRTDSKDITRPKKNLYAIIPLFVFLTVSIYFGIICLNAESHMAKAFIWKDKKDWKKMEYYVDKADSYFAPFEPNHSNPIVLYKGLAKFEQKQFETSLVYFNEALKKHPNSISALNNLGSAYGQLNIIDSSMIYQKKSLAIFPHYERGLTNLSKSYYLKNEFEKAYQVILCCDPESENKEVENIRRVIEQKLLK